MDVSKLKRTILTYLTITFGVVLIAVSYYFLFLPQNLVIGGVSGISIIFNGIIPADKFSPSLLIFILNCAFLILGLLFLGKDFVLKTLYGSLLFPLITGVLEICNVPPTLLFDLDFSFGFAAGEMNEVSKMIMTVILGSLATGIGVGLCFKRNASTGGMDVGQKIIAKFFHFPYSKTVYVTDGIIVLISLFVFGVEKTFYSLICIYIIGIIVDYVHIGGADRRTVFIISKKQEDIKKVIIERLGRGVTVVPSYGGYSGDPIDMLVCTLKKDESYVLRDLIAEIDPVAFTFYVSAKEVFGDGFE